MELPVVLGYEVVAVTKSPHGDRVRRISPRVYQVKTAAEDFCAIARGSGIDCYVREALGTDSIGGRADL